MKYYKINWIHPWGKDEYPYLFLVEIGADLYETKKIEFFKSGNICCADEQTEDGTFLSPIPIHLDEYNSEDELEIIKATEISKDEFYQEWNKLNQKTQQQYCFRK